MHLPQRSLYLKCLTKPCPKCGAQIQEECEDFWIPQDKQGVCMQRLGSLGVLGTKQSNGYTSKIPWYVTRVHDRTFGC